MAQQDKDEVRFPRSKEAGHTPSASDTLPPSHAHGIEMVVRYFHLLADQGSGVLCTQLFGYHSLDRLFEPALEF